MALIYIYKNKNTTIMVSNDPVISKYVKNNLSCWKDKKLDESKLIDVINKYKLSIAQIEIKNKNVTVTKLFNTRGNYKLDRSLNFLRDVTKEYPSLDTKLYLFTHDTLTYDNINIYNVDGTLGNPDKLDDFCWGVSKSNPDYVRILETHKIPGIDDYFPVFCFERQRQTNGILFPAFGADNKNIKVSQNIDNIPWHQKDNATPIFRGVNICCDLGNIDKCELVNFSDENPQETDFKFSSNKKHPLWDKYIVSESHLKLFQNMNIINTKLNLNEFRENFTIDNFVSYSDMFKHKFIVTVGSAKNRKWYQSNSCILEYQFKNKEYFHEDVFDDMKDIMYFNTDNFFDKIDVIKQNDYNIAKNMVHNRKDKFNNYLHYPNLVKWYGKFLIEYQNMF